MIELMRYARLKPEGLVTEVILPDGSPLLEGPGLEIRFKRFDVETGKEVSPEVSALLFSDLEKRLAELKIETKVLEDLLALRHNG